MTSSCWIIAIYVWVQFLLGHSVLSPDVANPQVPILGTGWSAPPYTPSDNPIIKSLAMSHVKLVLAPMLPGRQTRGLRVTVHVALVVVLGRYRASTVRRSSDCLPTTTTRRLRTREMWNDRGETEDTTPTSLLSRSVHVSCSKNTMVLQWYLEE